jgi:hypothetical protein
LDGRSEANARQACEREQNDPVLIPANRRLAIDLQHVSGFSLSLDPAERAALDKAAIKEDRSSAYVVRPAIVDWVKEHDYLK